MLRYLITTTFLLTATLHPALALDPETLSEARGKNGMVVSVSPPATDAGLAILKAGGNAVDAAIAVEFALAVTWPEAGNIGGGGFMLVHPPGGREAFCIDYRETAPGAAREKMFSPQDGKHSHKIVGVPGTVRGMALAHQRFGKLDWKPLLMPAVKLAADGFVIDEALAGSLNGVLTAKGTREGEHHRELIRVYGKKPQAGEATAKGQDAPQWQAGDRLVLPDLAKTLQRIADQGADGFYRGETAELLVAEMQAGDGLIAAEDLVNYEAKERRAVHGKFRGYDVYGAPPPSSGGTCLVEMLNVLEGFNLREHGRYSARNLHIIAETMKRVFCDRAQFLGDQDFVNIPKQLTRKPYARKLAADIDERFATPSETLAPQVEVMGESPSTTHFSVIDGEGFAVSNTTTLEASWGARIVVKGAGFVLNNEMGDFNWFPGHTDRSGNIGTKANRIAPGKRMLSSQSPTIVAYKGHPVMITGSPGGRTIINTTLQMVLNVIEFEMDLPEAMRAARIHHQWLPDKISYETFTDQITPETAAELEAKGHVLSARKKDSTQGDAHSIAVDLDSGEFHGVADWRRNGKAAGY
jgi:gamma-glutamyltranspeptidase/glutathione hydrolase